MEKEFILKSIPFRFSDVDVKQAAKKTVHGKRDRVKFYAEIDGRLYPARQLLVEMIRNKGVTMPDIITHQAIGIIRALGFEIKEILKSYNRI